MKRLIFTLMVCALMATPVMASPSLHFATVPGTGNSWTLSESGGTWTLSFVVGGRQVTDNVLDPVYLDLLDLPQMTLSNIVDQGAYISADLTPTGPLTIRDNLNPMTTVMTASVATGGSATFGTTYVAYQVQKDDLNITALTAGYSAVLDGFQTAENNGLSLDLGFTGTSTTNLYTLLKTNASGSSASGTIDGAIIAIPAPGAILLGSIGVGLVGWLRRRKTL